MGDQRVESFPEKFCHVCDFDESPNEKNQLCICTLCAHPSRVRMFCQSCKMHFDFSLTEARHFFGKAGLDIWRTGIVLRFKECAVCNPVATLSPRIFYLDNPPTGGFQTNAVLA